MSFTTTKFRKATNGKELKHSVKKTTEFDIVQLNSNNTSMFFLDQPIFEDQDKITLYHNVTFKGQENLAFETFSSFMQENQTELVPVVMLAEPEFMYCVNSRKMT